MLSIERCFSPVCAIATVAGPVCARSAPEKAVVVSLWLDLRISVYSQEEKATVAYVTFAQRLSNLTRRMR